MVVKVIPVSDCRVTLVNKSGSFTSDYINNEYIKALIEKYGTPLYLNVGVENDRVHVTGLARGTF